MKTEIFVHAAFSHLRDFIRQIPGNFSSLGDEIYVGRNDVRLISINGQILAIKYFKRMTLANRYIFATVRKSKARRAFEYSERLLQKGITSPQPVAYINCYKYGKLFRCFYISLYTHYLPVNEFLVLPVSESEEALKAFARFIYRVHQEGFFHKDLTIRNVLFSYVGNQYDFSLIDNNRMRFRNYSFKRAMNNLKRLVLPVETIGIVAAEYARVASVSDVSVLNAFVFNRWRFEIRNLLKKWAKVPLHLLSPNYRNSSMIIRKETELVAQKVPFTTKSQIHEVSQENR